MEWFIFIYFLYTRVINQIVYFLSAFIRFILHSPFVGLTLADWFNQLVTGVMCGCRQFLWSNVISQGHFLRFLWFEIWLRSRLEKLFSRISWLHWNQQSIYLIFLDNKTKYFRLRLYYEVSKSWELLFFISWLLSFYQLNLCVCPSVCLINSFDHYSFATV